MIYHFKINDYSVMPIIIFDLDMRDCVFIVCIQSMLY